MGHFLTHHQRVARREAERRGADVEDGYGVAPMERVDLVRVDLKVTITKE